MSLLQKRLLKNRNPLSFGKKTRKNGNFNSLPVSWNKYFEEKQIIEVNNDHFCIYKCGQNHPVVFLLHGGGFSALSWALFSVIALDLRGHGETKTESDQDLCIKTLSQDVVNVFNVLFKDNSPPVLLMGHSMGGAVAIHVAYENLLPTLLGLIVIDVVEGTAIDALSGMQSFLHNRPSSFVSVNQAIDWCIDTGQLAATEVADNTAIINTASPQLSQTSLSILQEELKQEETKSPLPQQYKWRIDLSCTEPYWIEWFHGLSSKFLESCIPKLLLLAGVDRLDKTLTLGQMQGRFQVQILPQAGHAVHEDLPERVAEVVASFLIRHRAAQSTEHFKK